MPRVIVLFFGDEAAAPIATAVVEGAKSIRFTEVELRGGSRTGLRQMLADGGEIIAGCDGLVIVSATDAVDAEVAQLLDLWKQRDEVQNVVFGVIGAPALVERMARLGGLLVTHPPNSGGSENATALGARVASVAGWVRHALGHEAEHAHGDSRTNEPRDHHHEGHDHAHAHEHEHAHDHEHDHPRDHHH